MDFGSDPTGKLINALSDIRLDDIEWQRELDELFLNSVFEEPDPAPFFVGPDSLPYYAFVCSSVRRMGFTNTAVGLEQAIGWGTGGALQVRPGETAWVYSPGDIVSLVIYKSSVFSWKGEWGEEPRLEDYSDYAEINVGSPNRDMLPPPAARCLEQFLRRVYKAEPGLAGRTPKVGLLRPMNRTRPEQPSELVLNAYQEDFVDMQRWESFDNMVRFFLPKNLRKRLIAFSTARINDSGFAPLTKLIADGGLEPIPEY